MVMERKYLICKP